MEDNEKMKFPIPGAEVCPACGCKERVVQKYIRELKDEDKLSKLSFPREGLVIQASLFDQTRPPLAASFTIPIFQIFIDVCLECKHMYCTGIDVVQQQATIEMNPQFKKI